MSTLTKCNYCSNKELIETAKKQHMELTYIKNRGVLKGIDVYIHPSYVNVRALSTVDRKQYFVEWYMELGKSCEC